jgi:RNAse (barnase) inhibitor barstar
MQSSLKSSPIQTITLDGRLFHDRESFFDEMVRIFDLPSYFGRNLDALYDSLSEYGVSVLILWQFHEASKQ